MSEIICRNMYITSRNGNEAASVSKKTTEEGGGEREGQEILLCTQETVLHMLIAARTTPSITARVSPGGEHWKIGW